MMVGIAGRSKACLTCRQRRRGCDLRRPTCKNCEDSGYACRGYNDELCFVVYSDDWKTKQAGDLGKSQLQPCTPQRYEPCQLPMPFRKSPLTSLILGLAWPSLAGSNNQPIHFQWIQSLPSVQQHGTVPNTALMSVALARRGQAQQDISLIAESEVVYLKALSMVSRLCHDKTKATSDDALASVLLLALYETLQGTSSRVSTWMVHTGGLYQLFKSRGATVHDTFNSLALFRDFRFQGLAHAIGHRKSTFLADWSWKGDPWQLHHRSDKDRLLDLMCHVPSLLETADTLKYRKDIPSALSALYALRQSYADLTESLEAWRDAFISKRTTPIYWYETAKEFVLPGEVHLRAMHPVALNFPDIETAETQILYWTTELILHTNFWALYHFVQQTDVAGCEIPGGFPTLDPSHETYTLPDLYDPLEKEWKIRVYVHNIVGSLEYFLRADVGVLALNIIVFPISLSMAFLEFFGDPKLDYLQAVMDKFLEKLGVPLGSFIRDMPNYETLCLAR